MTLGELGTVLEAIGFPVTYRAWPVGKAPALPYICYLATGTNPLHADGQVYWTSENVRVELYTSLKDPAAEAKVEAALKGFHWKKYDTYIDTERCYMITYEIEV